MKAKLTLTLLTMAALCSGCEIVGPLLVAEAAGGGGSSSASAALSVQIETADGTLAGRALAPEMFEPTGSRFGDQLDFHFAIPDEDFEVVVIMSQAESSSTNPYTGEGMDFGGGSVPIPEGRPVPGDAGVLLGSEGVGIGPFSDVMICESGLCRSAQDFGVEIVQTADGRRAVVDGAWGAGDSARITFRYSESR